MSRLPSILYVDPDVRAGRELAEVFEAAGLDLHAVCAPPLALEAARTGQVEWLLVRSETRGPVLAQTLAVLGADAAWARLPVVVLCEDVAEHPFVRELRSGVVALMNPPEDPGQLIRDLRALWEGLPRRSGVASGTLDSPGLAALVEHLRRTQRSGGLTLNAGAADEGRALFARGQLRSAEHRDLQGVEALLAMVSQPRATFSFTQLGDEGGEALIDVELSVQGPDDDGWDLDVEVGDVAPDEIEVPVARRTAAQTPILLVDDDESLCRMFSILFRKHGFEVTAAPDGLAGYEAALEHGFELAVVDLNMPRMDGWGMLRLLREDHRTRELPVAFLSCHDDYRDSLRALNSGAQAYFSKSTRLDALAAQVRALLGPRAAARKALAARGPSALPVGTLGAQWVIGEMARQGLTGTLSARDGWASYRLTFRDGAPEHASAQSGRHVAQGPRALDALVASRGADGQFVPGPPAQAPNLKGSAAALLAASVELLNANDRRVREGLLVRSREVQVNQDLYALYAQVGPSAWLETARLICEERLAPREIIARVDASPLDVEETLRDLVRRGVVSLSA
jgi:DNA-binding response OmpR family regulator